jgi:hypothetical protein
MIPHLGVLSRHTGDWTNPQKAIDAGIKSVTIKLTDGDGTDDVRGVPNARIAESSGVPWSAGTYPEPNGTAPSAQAMKLIERSMMVSDRPELPYSLNVEGVRVGTVPPPDVYGRFLRTMVDTIMDEDGRPPIMVVQQNWWDDKVAPSGIAFDDCWLRVMEWPAKPSAPPIDPAEWEAWIAPHQPASPDPVVGWDTWHAWQFSCNALGVDYGFTGGTTPNICVNIVKDDVHAAWTAPEVPDLQAQIDQLWSHLYATGELVNNMAGQISSLSLDIDAQAAAIKDNYDSLARQIETIKDIQSNHAGFIVDLTQQLAALDVEALHKVAYIFKAVRDGLK